MPWEWQPDLKKVAEGIGLDFFSTPYDITSLEFLEDMGVPVHKLASFELVDIPFIKKMAATGKPLIISTGMGHLKRDRGGGADGAWGGCDPDGAAEVQTAVIPRLLRRLNLATIPHMSEAFGLPVGLSDHTLGISVPVAAVALGACVVEKHFTLSRSVPGPGQRLQPGAARIQGDGGGDPGCREGDRQGVLRGQRKRGQEPGIQAGRCSW